VGNSVTSFDFEGSNLRFGTTDDKTPYVVASDFAKALGYRDAGNALRILDDVEKGTQIVSTLGGPQEMSVIYEDGIWELIFRSTLPGAKLLKARVKEILREIRKTGSYSAAPRDDLSIMRSMIDALEADRRKVAELEIGQRALERRVAVLDENSGWVAAKGWARVNGLVTTDNVTMSRLGRQASKIMRQLGIPLRTTTSEQFGTVGIYPEGVLERAAEELGLQ